MKAAGNGAAASPEQADLVAAHARRRSALFSVAAAVFLVALKLGTGLASGSLGLISAGIESSGDVIAAVLTFFALRFAIRPADAGHPYGHRRAENLAALGEAAILAGGGIFVVVEAISQLTGGHSRLDARWYVFVVIAVALVIDASRVIVSLRSSVKYRSAALRSNAFHFAGDMLGSLAVLGGVTAVAAGFEQGDAVAALVVACVIFTAAGRLGFENTRVLMDTAPADAQERARRAVESLGDGVELRRLRLRESGGRYFADAVVGVPPGRAVVEGHAAADEVEDAIRDALPESDVVVHVEPKSDGLSLRERALATALREPLVHEAHDINLYEHEGGTSISLHLKLRPEVPLEQAHEVAERIEAALRAQPGVAGVQTHLEPLERPLAADPSEPDDAAEARRIRELVEASTGQSPRELSVMRTPAGQVVFLTVEVGPGVGLSEAHELASRLEEDIRRGQPQVADVVVHTEPTADRRG
jgi:cation diffusion facilitator family transporter